jgi:ABC-type multidrug transport system fused ATPase/permease subunit
VTEPELISSNFWLNWAYTQLAMTSVRQFISLVGLIIVVVFYVKAYLYYLSQAYIAKFSFSQKGELCTRLMRGYLTVSYTFHLNRNSAEIIKGISSDTYKFCYQCLIHLLNLTASLTVVFILVLLLAKTDLVLLVGIFSVLMIAFLIYYRFKEKIARWGKEGSEANIEMIRIVNQRNKQYSFGS